MGENSNTKLPSLLWTKSIRSITRFKGLMSMISWQLWEQKSSSKRLSIQIFPMISFCLSNTTSQPSKCIRICWLCTQLMHATRKLFQLKTSTPLLIQWSHCLWRNSQRDQKCYQHLPVTWWGTSNDHQKRKNLLLHCKRMAGLLVLCYLAKEEMKKFRSSLFLLWKQEQKMMRGKLTGYTQLKIMWMIMKKSMSLR